MATVKTDSKHYTDIAAAIRSKNGSASQYKPQEMPGAILELEAGSLNSSILVYAPTGSQITLIRGDVVRTVPENNGVWRFDNCELGTWTVNASKDGKTKITTVEIQEQGQLMRYEVQIQYTGILGIVRNITSSSPEWTRTDMAEGLTATASVGSVAGSSDFDNYNPWGNMQRETLSTGDVMVRIPKFWYKRYREGNLEYLKITDVETDGFRVHPAFCRGGVERDAIYVGAYKASSNNTSISGVVPKCDYTRAKFRSHARNKGDGWDIMDVTTWSAIQMLFLVEYATFDSQGAIGKGCSNMGQSYGRSSTGDTDSVPNLTGIPAGTDGKVNAVWRGLEGLWGNMYEALDGLNMASQSKAYYVCTDPDNYGETIASGFTALSYAMPIFGSNNVYVTRLGLDPDFDYVMLPEAASGGSSSTYICDGMSAGTASVNLAKVGGKWYDQDSAGLFMLDATNTPSSTSVDTGFRLIYVP